MTGTRMSHFAHAPSAPAASIARPAFKTWKPVGIAAREGLTAKRSRPEMAPQPLEKIESAPGNGMVSEASNPLDLVHGRAADRARLRLTRRMNDKDSGVGQSCRKRRPSH